MTVTAAVGAREAVDQALGTGRPVDLSWLERPATAHDWSLADDALRFLARLVSVRRPARVVEFGSGVSTRVLARVLSPSPSPRRLLTVENDPAFAAATLDALEDDGTDAVVDLQLAGVVVRLWHGRHVPVYDLDEQLVRPFRGAPIMVVDGPPLPLGGREGSLIQAVHLAGAGTIVVLDDADRPSETAALERLGGLFGEAIEVVPLAGFTKGLSVIIVHEPVGGPTVSPPPWTATEDRIE